jgi:branched-chain amino acid transport system permease protein
VKWIWPVLIALSMLGVGLLLTGVMENRYIYFATYVILQYIVLATAWNILGGYTGYVNFGTPAFFALGAYAATFLMLAFKAPFLVLLLGYLTLRLKGVFFSIATLALTVVLQTLIINWEFVGGAKGISIIRPATILFFSSYSKFLFVVMLCLAIGAVAIARWIEHSWIGRGLAAIRDNEEAAECMGVPTLKLKILATTLSGCLMGMAGVPFPWHVTLIEPGSAFNLDYAVNSLAMPMIGGTTTWVGPLVGAVLLGVAQQVATVTISSELNLLIVGVVLVAFVILAPEGLVGLVRRLVKREHA